MCRDVNKAALLRAFEEYGHITGHTFLHASDCVFIDFESERDAAAGKEALEGALSDGHRIRIEFKDEARGPPQGGGRRMPPAYGGADARQSSFFLDGYMRLHWYTFRQNVRYPSAVCAGRSQYHRGGDSGSASSPPIR